ncbi:MAG: D-alanine--D-alanine ligase [Armatimonadota bacterium]
MSLQALRERRIAVLMGGRSREREVSLRSGAGVLGALRRQGFDAVAVDPRPDLVTQLREVGAEVVVNVLHGGAGENGTIQGALEVAGIPYTGSGVLASALAMDKVQSKRIFAALGIPTPPHVHINCSASPEQLAAQAIEQFGLPAVTKPRAEGSSLGVSIPKTQEQLVEAIAAIMRTYGEGIIDRYIRGTEITVGIVGAGERTRALPVLELVPKNEFYDYEAKYTKGMTELIAPARISPQATALCQRLALRAHHALGCVGPTRVDMHLDTEGNCWVHEINSVPGMTETSDLPHAAAAEGVSYDELVLQILETALTRM